jgi:hypothetical protein
LFTRLVGAGAAAAAVPGLTGPAQAAPVAVNLPCDWKSVFAATPNVKSRVGFLTSFDGLGLSAPLASDLAVFNPWTGTLPPSSPPAPHPGKANVVGLIENISWNGGVGDAITISCYMSSKNADLLKAPLKAGFQTMAIKLFAFWVAGYDNDRKVWFEQFYPVAPNQPAAMLNAPSKNDIRLHIADAPVMAAPNVMVVNVYFELVPAAQQTATFTMASAFSKNVTLPWGSKTGTLTSTTVKHN